MQTPELLRGEFARRSPCGCVASRAMRAVMSGRSTSARYPARLNPPSPASAGAASVAQEAVDQHEGVRAGPIEADRDRARRAEVRDALDRYRDRDGLLDRLQDVVVATARPRERSSLRRRAGSRW